jgi:hypothetical protein
LKIAIVGSKRTKFSNANAIQLMEAHLDKILSHKPDLAILAGCPLNRDSWVRDYLTARQIPFVEYDPPGPFGIGSRNQRIVDECDELLAFWSGDAGSNTLAITKAAKESSKTFRLFLVKETLEELKDIP